MLVLAEVAKDYHMSLKVRDPLRMSFKLYFIYSLILS